MEVEQLVNLLKEYSTLGIFILLVAILLINIIQFYNQRSKTSLTHEHLLQLLNEQALAKQNNAEQEVEISQLNQLTHSFKPYLEQQFSDLKMKLMRQQLDQSQQQQQQQNQFSEKILKALHEHQQQFSQNQHKAVDQLIEHLSKASQSNRQELAKSLDMGTVQLTLGIEKLTESTDKRLKEINTQVEHRLAEGFEKTTKTFNDILKRLALIDDAQKKITELSTNVVSLQEVLADKRSRGAFGEVQLTALIRNVLPEQHFSLQHTLSNGKIADCVLLLPAPTGNVVIDSKFPLESYKKMADNQLGEYDRKAAERQFKVDIKKHINDISDKYLIDRETSDGAIMFIPAEAIFAEIHAHQSDLVDYANKKRVWLTSPTTLMAILTTSRSVLKDEETRKQIHIIQAHLSELSGDFGRFRSRFNNLAKHIDQAANDVKQIHTSADKISNRFEKIENVDLDLVETSKINTSKLKAESLSE